MYNDLPHVLTTLMPSERHINDNSCIFMSELFWRVTENEREVDRLRIFRVRAHQTQQKARHNEHERFYQCSTPMNLERAAFHYDPEI